MRYLVIGQRPKAPNFSAFHWSPHGCLITIGQHFVTTRVVHLPKWTETSLITESDQSRANHQLLQLCTVRTAWSDSDQAVRAVHSCKSWFLQFLEIFQTSIVSSFQSNVRFITLTSNLHKVTSFSDVTAVKTNVTSRRRYVTSYTTNALHTRDFYPVLCEITRVR